MTDQFAECAGKWPYRSKHEAFSVVGRRSKRHGKKARHCEFSVYRCPHCNEYHVGSTIKPNRKLRRL